MIITDEQFEEIKARLRHTHVMLSNIERDPYYVKGESEQSVEEMLQHQAVLFSRMVRRIAQEAVDAESEEKKDKEKAGIKVLKTKQEK